MEINIKPQKIKSALLIDDCEIEQCVKTSMLTRTIKYLILGLAFCFCHLTLLAQNKKIDSLLTLTNTDNADTNK